MKNLILNLINIYQKIVSPLLHQFLGQKNLCRYEISCSEFAKSLVVKYGVLKGSGLALRRIISCQPFTKTKSYANI